MHRVSRLLRLWCTAGVVEVPVSLSWIWILMCKEYPETCHHGCWHLSDISSLISLSIISPFLVYYHWYQVTWNPAVCYGFLKKLSFRLVHGVPFLCPYLSHLLGLVLGWATRCSETTWENSCQVGYLLLSDPTLVWTMQANHRPVFAYRACHLSLSKFEFPKLLSSLRAPS